MKTKMILIVAVGFAIFSCSNKRDSDSNDQISGAYAREYSFKVTNLETGAEIGMRTIRDTILIEGTEEKYKVSNRKWLKNDYDIEEWRSMKHSADRPFESYTAIVNNVENSLVSPTMICVKIDVEKSLAKICDSPDVVYRKAK